MGINIRPVLSQPYTPRAVQKTDVRFQATQLPRPHFLTIIPSQQSDSEVKAYTDKLATAWRVLPHEVQQKLQQFDLREVIIANTVDDIRQQLPKWQGLPYADSLGGDAPMKFILQNDMATYMIMPKTAFAIRRDNSKNPHDLNQDPTAQLAFHDQLGFMLNDIGSVQKPPIPLNPQGQPLRSVSDSESFVRAIQKDIQSFNAWPQQVQIMLRDSILNPRKAFAKSFTTYMNQNTLQDWTDDVHHQFAAEFMRYIAKEPRVLLDYAFAEPQHRMWKKYMPNTVQEAGRLIAKMTQVN